MTKNFYVTSPIYYVNDAPHIGHAYTSVACDVLARFRREQGFNTFFLTGTDEHGQKVEKSAIEKGKTAQELCDENSCKFKELAQDLRLSNDDFIRTTEERHKICAQEIWRILEEKGAIYKGVYEGWYAVRDEAFYGEDEIVDGKAPSGAEVKWEKQESYFFKLSKYQDKLLALYEAVPDFIRPKSKMNEVVSFVKSGLKDLSISRNSFSWGVKVPGSEKNDEKEHIMYVWLDALTNYLSALGFASGDDSKYQDFWQNASESPIHIVGKDILRFHGVYWPAFLMAAEINLPHSIYAHGWWTNEGEKISKSVGNVIKPQEEIDWIKSFGCDDEVAVDYFKYFLMREVHFGNDGDYKRDAILGRINTELANNIGNLAQRSLSMINKNNEGLLVDVAGFEDEANPLKKAHELQENLAKKMDDLAFDDAIYEIIDFASTCNQFLNEKAPWKLKKEGKEDEMNQILSVVANALAIIGTSLVPFLPTLSLRLLGLLNLDKTFKIGKLLASGHKISETKIVFPKLEVK